MDDTQGISDKIVSLTKQVCGEIAGSIYVKSSCDVAVQGSKKESEPKCVLNKLTDEASTLIKSLGMEVPKKKRNEQKIRAKTNIIAPCKEDRKETRSDHKERADDTLPSKKDFKVTGSDHKENRNDSCYLAFELDERTAEKRHLRDDTGITYKTDQLSLKVIWSNLPFTSQKTRKIRFKFS